MRIFFHPKQIAILGVVGLVLGWTMPWAYAMPQIGWQAQLSEEFHNVSGTVSIVDEDTLEFQNFTYDGGGLSVYFYLGIEDTSAAFKAGLPIGSELFGSVFDGTQAPFRIDLPDPHTIGPLQQWNAISVWCVTAGVSFGSGRFHLPGDFDLDGDVDGSDFLDWQKGDSPNPFSQSDLDLWKSGFDTPDSLSAIQTAVPEPATACGWLFCLFAMLYHRTASIRSYRSQNY